MSEKAKACTTCRSDGTVLPGRATVAFDEGNTVVVIRAVPAEVCSNCGERYFTSETTEKLLEIARTAGRPGVEVEIVTYADAA